MEESLPQPQVPVPKRFPLKWLLIIALLAGIVLTGTYLIFKSQSGFSSIQSNKVVNTNETVKIGEYKILAKDGWEELEYLSAREAKNTNDVYSIFSQLYPNYVDKKNEMYVKDIVVKGDTAEVYFGGDESWLTNRMGSTGPYNYSGLITFALTQDPKIQKVDFKLKLAGTHFGPGIRAREDFIDLWPNELLEKAAVQGNKQAQDILQFRKTANWKTYTNQKFSYTFKYPNIQSIDEKENPIENYPELLSSTTFYGINGEVNFFINTWSNLGIIIRDNKTRDIWCKSTIEKQPKNLIRNVLNCLEATPTEINGMKAFLSKGAVDNSYLSIFHIAYGNYVYELTITTGKNYPQTTFSISNQILSTFKFTDQTNAEGAFCGGIAGKICPEGYKCQLDGSYPDAGGKCVKE